MGKSQKLTWGKKKSSFYENKYENHESCTFTNIKGQNKEVETSVKKMAILQEQTHTIAGIKT